jgi:hypothetical protein
MLTEWRAMTGTLGANAVWSWMPFMAGLNGEDGPHAQGIRYMELKVKVFKGFNEIEPGHVNEFPNIQIHLDPHARLP